MSATLTRHSCFECYGQAGHFWKCLECGEEVCSGENGKGRCLDTHAARDAGKKPHDCEEGEYAFCRECDEIVCRSCAATWEEDGEYIDGRLHGRTTVICKACDAKPATVAV